jgi:adenine-specific DNA-methyltransferase
LKKSRGSKAANSLQVEDYRYSSTRKNIPEAALAASGRVPPAQPLEYDYSPRLDPKLRFDSTGVADDLADLLTEAQARPLTPPEAQRLRHAMSQSEPWLEWAGKREKRHLTVEPVALHIHERVSTQAILRAAKRVDIPRDLFADPQLSYRDAVKFYQHDVDWANRLILGDSLQVMASLAAREDLAGRVQMIYMDPPYGIRYGSNFQPDITNKDVKDKDSDLTREPEMVKAYRDTWELGVHSFLTYLRDRLAAAKTLLSDRGSIFVQISEDNIHRVRLLLDEIFGSANFVSLISFQTTSGFADAKGLSRMGDYLLWYARDRSKVKVKTLYEPQEVEPGAQTAKWLITLEGEYRGVTKGEAEGERQTPPGARFYLPDNLQSQGAASSPQPFEFEGKTYTPASNSHWKPNYPTGLSRLAGAGRIHVAKDSIRYRRLADDFPLKARGNIWTDTLTGSFTDAKLFAVQTSPKVVERCLLMTTDAGDLVLDPTCGSGTTAFVAEHWGRRWITIDTSRVAVAIARQRLLTEEYPFHELKNSEAGVSGGFRCRTLPRLTLRSIAQNHALDPIIKHHTAVLDEKLAAVNAALGTVADAIRSSLAAKLKAKQKKEGKRSISEADRRRWTLPAKGEQFVHWTVPFDTDPEYPDALQVAVSAYREAWKARQKEVDQAIRSAAEPEELIDQPEVVDGIVRVSGPFTVEAVQPAEVSLDAVLPTNIDDELDETFDGTDDAANEMQNVEAYLDDMVRLLRSDGVRFPDNKVMKFSRLDSMASRSTAIHAEGRWVAAGEMDEDSEGNANVAVAFGPQSGPVTAKQVELLLRAASRRGYDALVVAGFAFDAAAQAILEEDEHPTVRVHLAHIRPDVNPGMSGLLKTTPASQLFTVFGQPRSKLETLGDGLHQVEMHGVDIYDPVQNTIAPARADKVAAWFLDTDYDGRTFCITQAFFPNKKAWSKISAALKGRLTETDFEALTSTTSLPFEIGENGCVAVKVIDPRGNEVLRLHRAGEDG